MSLSQSVLVKTLALLNKRQQKKLLIFADCPLHNTREDVRRILAKLIDSPPKDEEESEMVFAFTFDNAKYNAKQARYTQSFAFSVLQDFMAWEIHKELAAPPHTLLRQLLIPRGEDTFKHLYQETYSNLQDQSLRDANYHLSMSRLLEMRHEISLLHRRSDASDLLDSTKQTAIFFVAERLRQGCALLLHNQMHGESQRPDLFDESLALASTPAFLQHKAVAVYYYAYHALTNTDDDEPLDQLLQILQSPDQYFVAHEARGTILLAVNCCIRRINAGRLDYLENVLNLYEIGLKQGVFFEGGFLSRFTYNNIIVAALRLKRYDWAQQFALQYADRIDPTYREGTKAYNLALIAYQQGRHNDALDLLQQITKNDKLHQLDARRMLLRIYYDLHEWDALESLLDSFKLYIYRQKDLGYHRPHYLNLIRFVRARIRINPNDKIALTKLQNEVNACKSIAERPWLLEIVGG
jgi:hypothetical protein